MWQAVWKIERRRVAWVTAVISAAIVLVGLFWTGQLEPLMFLIGSIQGIVLAAALFSDPPGVAAFVFSLPISRSRLFVYRWLIGLAAQAVSVALFALLVIFGLREDLQSVMDQGMWYPMIRWSELSFAWHLGLYSLATYQISMFVILKPRQFGRSDATVKRMIWVAVFWLPVVIYGSFISQVAGSEWDVANPVLAGSLFVVTFLTTVAARHCFCRAEIAA